MTPPPPSLGIYGMSRIDIRPCEIVMFIDQELLARARVPGVVEEQVEVVPWRVKVRVFSLWWRRKGFGG